MSTDWHFRAACLGMEIDDWFPPNNTSDATRAQAICYSCPVRKECLDLVMRAEVNSTRCGIFGGLTASDRNRYADGDRTVLQVPKHRCGHPKSIENTHWVDGRARCVHCSPPVVCGTRPGYRRHLKNGEEACGPCRRAHSIETSKSYANRRAAAA